MKSFNVDLKTWNIRIKCDLWGPVFNVDSASQNQGYVFVPHHRSNRISDIDWEKSRKWRDWALRNDEKIKGKWKDKKISNFVLFFFCLFFKLYSLSIHSHEQINVKENFPEVISRFDVHVFYDDIT